MKVSELKELLDDYGDHMDVVFVYMDERRDEELVLSTDEVDSTSRFGLSVVTITGDVTDLGEDD